MRRNPAAPESPADLTNGITTEAVTLQQSIAIGVLFVQKRYSKCQSLLVNVETFNDFAL
jgi:hypothetical protein